jgi:sugar phosphate isomerase/epimerase
MLPSSTARPLSLAALTVIELSPPEMVSCAADAGYSHVGLRLLPATAEEPVYPVIGDMPMVREVARRLASTGVHVHDIEILRLKPATRAADYREALETGARLGARAALVAGNDDDESRLVANFAELAALADTLDLSLALEPMPWTDVRDVASGLRVIERSGARNAGLVIDAIHVDRAGTTPAELAALPASRIAYVQLCDAPAERPTDTPTLLHQARAERTMPGDGGLDLIGMLRALPPRIVVSVEVPMRTLSRTVDARERARRLREKTLRTLEAAASL